MLLHIEIDSYTFNPLAAVVLEKCVNISKDGPNFFKKDVKQLSIFTLKTDEVVCDLKKMIGDILEIEDTKIKLSHRYRNHFQISDEDLHYVTGDKNFFPIHRIDRPMSDLILQIEKYEDTEGVITFNLEDVKNIDLTVCHHLLGSVAVNPVKNIEKYDLLQLEQDVKPSI